MIPTIFIPLDAARVAQKAAHMAEVDPHGWIITIVSVSVVFLALLILFFCYSAIGKLCTGAATSLARKEEPGSDAEIAAAIGLALDRYMNECVHDSESYVITIRRK